MSRTVVISDLHVDKWDEERLEKFLDFIYYVRRRASRLVINGDIMDFPPMEGKEIDGVAKRVLSELAQLPFSGIQVIYLPGNHDIALRGFPILLPKVEVVYPSTVLQLESVRIYVEHGHYYDPLFNGGYDILEGIRKFTGYDVGRIAVDTWKAVTRWMQRASEDQSENDIGREDAEFYVLQRWQDEAKAIRERKGYDFVLFGHIHSPKGPTEAPSYYINTGDWVKHMTVTEFDEKGNPEQYDWRDRTKV